MCSDRVHCIFPLSLMSSINNRFDVRFSHLTPCVSCWSLIIDKMLDFGLDSHTNLLIFCALSLWFIVRSWSLLNASSGLPCHKSIWLLQSFFKLRQQYPDILKLLGDVKPVQDADELFAVRVRPQDDRPTVEGSIRKSCDYCVLLHSPASAALSRYVFMARWSSWADRAKFAINLTMMLVNRADAFWTVDNAWKGFKAAFILILSGIWPSTWTTVAGAAQSKASGDLKFSSDIAATPWVVISLILLWLFYRRWCTVNFSPGCFELHDSYKAPARIAT